MSTSRSSRSVTTSRRAPLKRRAAASAVSPRGEARRTETSARERVSFGHGVFATAASGRTSSDSNWAGPPDAGRILVFRPQPADHPLRLLPPALVIEGHEAGEDVRLRLARPAFFQNIVETGQRQFAETLGQDPLVERVQLLRQFPDLPALFRGRVGEGEGIETTSFVVAGAVFQRRSRCQGPNYVKAT